MVPEAQCAIKRSNKKPTLKAVSSSPSVVAGGGGGGATSGPLPDYRLKLARPLKPEEEELINQVKTIANYAIRIRGITKNQNFLTKFINAVISSRRSLMGPKWRLYFFFYNNAAVSWKNGVGKIFKKNLRLGYFKYYIRLD